MHVCGVPSRPSMLCQSTHTAYRACLWQSVLQLNTLQLLLFVLLWPDAPPHRAGPGFCMKPWNRIVTQETSDTQKNCRTDHTMTWRSSWVIKSWPDWRRRKQPIPLLWVWIACIAFFLFEMHPNGGKKYTLVHNTHIKLKTKWSHFRPLIRNPR